MAEVSQRTFAQTQLGSPAEDHPGIGPVVTVPISTGVPSEICPGWGL